MKPLGLALVLAWPLATPGGLDSARDWDHFVNRTAGHALRIPPGYHTYVVAGSTIVFSRPVNPRTMPAQLRLQHGDVYLRVDQTPTKAYAGDERPRPFESLGPERDHDCGFGSGHQLLWREPGSFLMAFVRLGGRTGGDDALAIVNSLRVTE